MARLKVIQLSYQTALLRCIHQKPSNYFTSWTTSLQTGKTLIKFVKVSIGFEHTYSL